MGQVLDSSLRVRLPCTASATARYTEYVPECAPIAFLCPGLLTVATTGPRSRGSRAPQFNGSASTPKLLGCVASFTQCRVAGWMDMEDSSQAVGEAGTVTTLTMSSMGETEPRLANKA